MTDTTVYAVVKATIEIPVRNSRSNETLEELYRVAVKEAADIVRLEMSDKIRIVGDLEFSHAVVK